MMSIQIDTKSLELIICHQHQHHQIVLLCKHYEFESFIITFNRCCTVIRYFRHFVVLLLEMLFFQLVLKRKLAT